MRASKVGIPIVKLNNVYNITWSARGRAGGRRAGKGGHSEACEAASEGGREGGREGAHEGAREAQGGPRLSTRPPRERERAR